MTVRPVVSVIMPVRNEERYVAAAVQSLLNQTYEAFELVVVEDASTDQTRNILASFHDPRIVVIRRAEKSPDLGTMLNDALAHARGDLIARMDGDDVAYPARLERQVAALRADEQVGVVGAWADGIDESGRQVCLLRTPVTDVAIRWQLHYRNPLHHPSILVRRQLLEELGGYDPNMTHAEDYDLFVRATRLTRLVSIPVPLIGKRMHDDSVSVRNLAVQEAVVNTISAGFLAEHGVRDVDIDVLYALRWHAFRSVATVSAAARLLRMLYHSLARRADFSDRHRRRELRHVAGAELLELSRAEAEDGRLHSARFAAFRLHPLLVGGAAIRRAVNW